VKILLPGALLFVAACTWTRLRNAPEGDPGAPGRDRGRHPATTARFIGVTTLAFRQDPTSGCSPPTGKSATDASPPWAPFQAAVLDGASPSASDWPTRGSRRRCRRSPSSAARGEETVLEDSLGEWGWLRYAGRLAHGLDREPPGRPARAEGRLGRHDPGHNGALRLLATGATEKNPRNTIVHSGCRSRPTCNSLACGYSFRRRFVARGDPIPAARTAGARDGLALRDSAELWKFTPTDALRRFRNCAAVQRFSGLGGVLPHGRRTP